MNHRLINEEKEGNVKKVKGRNIYPKIPISLSLPFFFLFTHLIYYEKATSSS